MLIVNDLHIVRQACIGRNYSMIQKPTEIGRSLRGVSDLTTTKSVTTVKQLK